MRKRAAQYNTHSVWPKFFIILGAVFAALMIFILFVATRQIKPIEPIYAAIPSSETSSVEFSWPAYGNAAIGTIDDGLKSTHGSTEMQPTASIAKIITVLVVLDKYPIQPGSQGPIITMSQQDVDYLRSAIAAGGSNLSITAGQQLTQYQMIQGILLASSNNLSDSLATWAFGSLENYRAAANQWLAKNNLHETRIGQDASGYDPASASSTSDLFKIGVLAMKNDVTRDVVSQKTAAIPGIGAITNTDILIGIDGFVGIKTGFTDEAGACYLFAANHQSGDIQTTIVGVVTGQPTLEARFKTARALVDSAKNNLINETLVQKNQVVGTYAPGWESEINARATDNISVFRWRDEYAKPDVKLSAIASPANNGSVVGTANYRDKTTDIKTDGAISQPSLWWRLTNLNRLAW